MIKNLVIDNIALITHLEIPFEEGLTALSGETGSGKSIIVDSLGFVLGDRADKTLIKYGENSAEVTALFQVEEDSPVLDKLDEYGYGRDTEILLNRKMTVQGKNEIRIQGKTATLAILKEVCAELVDIFGQGQHLALLNEKNQLSVLDSFCDFHGDDVRLTELYRQFSALNRQLKSFGGSDAERERMLDMLKYQIDEIKAVNPDEEEEEQLLATHKRMANVEKIASALSIAKGCLGDENGAVSQIASAMSSLRSIANVESTAEKLLERLSSCRLELDDVASEVEDLLDSTEFSPAEADRVNARLEEIRTVKRKYGGSVAQALQFLQQAEEKYDQLLHSDEKIRQLTQEKQQICREMYGVACRKSEERHKTAQRLSQRIMSELADLGMKGTRFEVQFEETPTFEEYCVAPTGDGFDRAVFLMSANMGEPLKPLSKVISGGEMSRFMLAVKNITALAEKIPTMVFDEIDSGISGSMAQMVAQKLANVSSNKKEGYQCIVITHLPQIVAMSDVNLLINKIQQEGKTHTEVTVLQGEERVNEVARLMGGVGEHAQVNAAELLQHAKNYKDSLQKQC